MRSLKESLFALAVRSHSLLSSLSEMMYHESCYPVILALCHRIAGAIFHQKKSFHFKPSLGTSSLRALGMNQVINIVKKNRCFKCTLFNYTDHYSSLCLLLINESTLINFLNNSSVDSSNRRG